MQKSRLEAFSDGVFAIAFTLLVLEFHSPPKTTPLDHYLFSLWPSFLAYGISVLLIGLVWANHHSVFMHIQKVDRLLMFLNVLLLAVVAFLPFPTALLAEAIREPSNLRAAAFFYGLVITLGGVTHNAVWFYASRKRQLVNPAIPKALKKNVDSWLLLGPTSYAICTLTSLAAPWIAIVGYGMLIIFYWLPPRQETIL